MFDVVIQNVCKRCGRAMRNVAEITPLNGQPGLLAFGCEGCGTTHSVLLSGDAMSGAVPHLVTGGWVLVVDANRRGRRAFVAGYSLWAPSYS